MEPGELSLVVYATFKVIKKTFLSFAKKVLCFVFNCNIFFPYPKDTWCLERLLIFMKNTF